MRSKRSEALMHETFKTEIKLVPFILRMSGFKLFVAAFAQITTYTAIVYVLKSNAASAFANDKYLYLLFPLAALVSLWLFSILREAMIAYKAATYIVSLKKSDEELSFARNYVSHVELDRKHTPPIHMPARFCPHCGLLMMPGENICNSCHTTRITTPVRRAS
ncbi:MAG: hypothetical protein J6127_07320 [Clostridiales bacterium]|nr:hypothetical protein [Clostridiales bacterium]